MNTLFNKNNKNNEVKNKEKLWFGIFMAVVIFVGFLTIIPQLQELFDNISFSGANPDINRLINNPPAVHTLIKEKKITTFDHISVVSKLKDSGLHQLFNEDDTIIENYFHTDSITPSNSFSLTFNEVGAFVNMVLKATNNNFLLIELSMLDNNSFYLLGAFTSSELLTEENTQSTEKSVFIINNSQLDIVNNQLLFQTFNYSINGYPKEETFLLEELLNSYIAQTSDNYTVSDISSYFVASIINFLINITDVRINIQENVINFMLLA